MLVLRDLAVTYQNMLPAVQDISLEVPEKSVVALLGANGAGKTTIMRAISGLLSFHHARITRGSIFFDDEQIDRLATTQIVQRGIASVLEGRRLFADLTVEENLRAGALATRDAAATRRMYSWIMELFPVLRERRYRHAGYLSGGEQQMLAIGRALMASPRLLLLDEPSLGLAPFMVQQIRAIITEINARGTAVLLVEQNAHMALEVAHYGYVLETGRVVLAQTAGELLQNSRVQHFYLGLHESEVPSAVGNLRQRPRSARRWVI